METNIDMSGDLGGNMSPPTEKKSKINLSRLNKVKIKYNFKQIIKFSITVSRI